MIEKLNKKKGFWSSKGPYCDTVVSSRVRLARNVPSVPFPGRMSEGDAENIENIVRSFHDARKDRYIFIDLVRLDSSEKRYLRERNLITREMELGEYSCVLTGQEDEVEILVNEEDHFRIQAIVPGLGLFDAYERANRVDDELNEVVPFAFSRNTGYLTACPSNAGTGLKVSAILHLPVLTIKKKITGITSRVKKVGAQLSVISGESSRPTGSLYQVSNRISLGLSEIDIIELMDGVINKIFEFEDTLRDRYLSESKTELQDRIWRSYGILQNARKISYIEAMEHLSNVRLGVVLAAIPAVTVQDINELMVEIQWAHLQFRYNMFFKSTTESDEFRAEYLRERLS